MENTNQNAEMRTLSEGVTETQDPLNRRVKVSQYAISEMKAKNWNFSVGGYKATKKDAQEALDIGMSSVTAKWKGSL